MVVDRDGRPPSPDSERWDRLECLELEHAALKDDMARLQDDTTWLRTELADLKKVLAMIKTLATIDVG